MNALTPVTVERGILELLADPDLLKARASELLEATKTAETVQAKSIAAKIEADAAMKLAADTLAQAREVEKINASKSSKVKEQLGELEAAVAAAAAAQADNKARLAEWEQKLRAREDVIATREADLDKAQNDLQLAREHFGQEIEAAQETIARADRIRAASEG